MCYSYNRASGREQTAPLDVDYPPLVVRLLGVIAQWLICRYRIGMSGTAQ